MWPDAWAPPDRLVRAKKIIANSNEIRTVPPMNHRYVRDYVRHVIAANQYRSDHYDEPIAPGALFRHTFRAAICTGARPKPVRGVMIKLSSTAFHDTNG